ncbi:MAG: YbjQ family protein [Planctomycetes bacterium]|nr:YbjQ family protein [Planctomycetota bacterium]
MIVVTTEIVPGKRVVEVLGLVRGNAVRARHVGKDITAFFTNLVGGEMVEYTKLLAESREQALDRMKEEARARGADAIVSMRFASSEIAAGAAEILAYGTAVKLADE